MSEPGERTQRLGLSDVGRRGGQFELVAPTGIRSISYWNGDAWLSYAETAGLPTPGASAFTVAEYDVLWLSR